MIFIWSDVESSKAVQIESANKLYIGNFWFAVSRAWNIWITAPCYDAVNAGSKWNAFRL